jgi:mannose-6-phosphate isomerase-like protein (cupin superfamily)
MRRVITFRDDRGLGRLRVSDTSTRDLDVTALGWREIWATFPQDASYPHAPAGDPTADARWRSVFPAPGQTIFRVLEFRPDEARPGEPTWSPQESAFLNERLPGLLAGLDPDEPGMHATHSVDYIVIISGRICLEVDGGESVELGPGDLVVQNGARHAWRPLGRVTMACVLVGVAADHSLTRTAR